MSTKRCAADSTEMTDKKRVSRARETWELSISELKVCDTSEDESEGAIARMNAKTKEVKSSVLSLICMCVFI